MNIEFFKRSWMKFYKRGFITGFLVLTFMLMIDQFLQNPLFFSKITSITVFIYIVSTMFFAAIFCGLLAVIFAGVVTIVTKK